MSLVGLCSTWQEGALAVGAVRSLLSCCDAVRVFDGPIGEAPDVGYGTEWAAFKREPRVIVTRGEWESDAAKRTAMLHVTRRYPTPTWGVVLDGDEVLLWGEYLHEQIAYCEARDLGSNQVTLGVTVRKMEPGGSCTFAPERVIRLDLIDRYITSSYHMLTMTGVEIARGHVPALNEGDPDSLEIESSTGMQRRRPLHGEPHVLHRWHLRPPQRDAVQRQHAAERTDWDKLLADAGLSAAPLHETEQGIKIWLPQ